MLGIRKALTSDVDRRIEDLERRLEDERRRHKAQLDVLRKQLALIAQGARLSEKAILEGQLFNDVTPDATKAYVEETSDLLVLDVRSDREWESGYIPGAKHIPVDQLQMRLQEMSDKARPILVVCASGGRSAAAAQLLADSGFTRVSNAVGGMQSWDGEVAYPEKEPLDASGVEGEDRELIQQVIAVLDRDVRPNLQRDGGDVILLRVKDGVADLKMIGACHGCGSQKVTVEHGIKNHLIEMVPGITEVVDRS